MKTPPRLLAHSIVILAVLAGCNSMPAQNPQLEQARTDLGAMQSQPQFRELAAIELKQASDAVDTANAAWIKNDDAAEIDHLAYLARQRVAIAQQAVRQKTAEAGVASAEKNRDQARLAARTSEADMAQRQAQSSEQHSQASQRQAGDAQARNRALEAQLRDLNARQTERGLVVTLSDVLFDTDRDQLKPRGMRSVEKLAAVLKANPQRTVSIEGHTDSSGSSNHNLTLSDQRADTVRAALIEKGVYTGRISVHGYGETHPVSSNNSAEGRRQNRRVEIILSDENGAISAR